MRFALAVLRGTPIWVYLLFAFLLWSGLRRLRPTTSSFAAVWITPVLFVGWGLVGLVKRLDGSGALAVVLPWLAAAAVGALLGGGPRVPLAVDGARVQQPASPLPLIRNMLLFGAHYALNVAAATRPPLRETFLTWDVYVSGLGAGYFLGWALRFLQSYRAARTAPRSGAEPRAGDPSRARASR